MPRWGPRRIWRGSRPGSAPTASAAARTTKHRRARSGWDSLTPAETKIAALVEGGLSNPEIAAKLFLSRRTVASHVSHILKKLDVHSRTDIAREAALRNIESR